jgi:hypothetical protein
MTLLIIYKKDGYNIMLDDGVTPMEFIDGASTQNIPTLRDAIDICVEHGYKFEVI